MWSYDLDLRSIRLTVLKVVVSREGTCNNCHLLNRLIIF